MSSGIFSSPGVGRMRQVEQAGGFGFVEDPKPAESAPTPRPMDPVLARVAELDGVDVAKQEAELLALVRAIGDGELTEPREIKRRLSKVGRTLEELQSDLDAYQRYKLALSHAAERPKLEARQDELRSAIDEIDHMSAAVNGRIVDLRVELLDLEDARRAAEATLSEIRTNLTDVDIAERALRAEHQRFASASVAAIQSRIMSLEAERSTAEREMYSHRQRAGDLEAEAETARKRIVHLEAIDYSLARHATTESVNAMQEQSKAEIKTLRFELESRARAIPEVQSAARTAESRRDLLGKQLEEAKRELTAAIVGT